MGIELMVISDMRRYTRCGSYHMRVFLVVLDGVGAGWQPDAADYGDMGADTLGHVMQAKTCTCRSSRSSGCITSRAHPSISLNAAEGCFGKMMEQSCGKDTTTGHWEMAGIVLEKPFPTYPNGFPKEVIDEFTRRTGRGVLGNCAASGTEIIKALGAEHVRTGKPIVYTSADSVFQIAAHEERYTSRGALPHLRARRAEC